MSVQGPFHEMRMGLEGWVITRDDVIVASMHAEHAERAELVSLLNKGTHFEGMREALETIQAAAKGTPAALIARAALAAAAGEKERDDG